MEREFLARSSGSNSNWTNPSSSQPPEFEALQKTMEMELDQKRKEWEKEVERMHRDFFHLKVENQPEEAEVKSGRHKPDMLQLGSKDVYTELDDGVKVFRQTFQVQDYDADELNVKIENSVIRVTAKHAEEQEGKKSVTKQFERQVNIPADVEADSLVSYLSHDGVLTVEAPVKTPKNPSQPKIKIQTFTDSVPIVGEFDPFSQPQFQQFSAVNPNPAFDVPSEEAGSYNYPLIKETPHGKYLIMTIHMGAGYHPKQITVTLRDKKVSVKAKQEIVSGGRTSIKEFSRSFDISSPLDEPSFVAVLTGEGDLLVAGALKGTDNPEIMKQLIFNELPISSKLCVVSV